MFESCCPICNSLLSNLLNCNPFISGLCYRTTNILGPTYDIPCQRRSFALARVWSDLPKALLTAMDQIVCHYFSLRSVKLNVDVDAIRSDQIPCGLTIELSCMLLVWSIVTKSKYISWSLERHPSMSYSYKGPAVLGKIDWLCFNLIKLNLNINAGAEVGSVDDFARCHVTVSPCGGMKRSFWSRQSPWEYYHTIFILLHKF